VRYYLGVDWADQTHAVWGVDENGTKIAARSVSHTAEGFSEWGRELDEWRAQAIAAGVSWWPGGTAQGTLRCHITKMIVNHFAPSARSAWRCACPRARCWS
jgi:hypothetical protein